MHHLSFYAVIFNNNAYILYFLQTTSWTLSWILLVLANHPEVQDKVREEVLQALPTNAHVSIDHLDKMPYLYAVIKECQRYGLKWWWLINVVSMHHSCITVMKLHVMIN